jgi:hypothetical protein|tara:strand:- start:4189 stop:4710 length:522 start_codon:yes stop_codon:yes gene_type:complete
MTFEEKIIKNSSIRQKNLVRPAKIAFEKPDTGVTINKKGAYYLIKDSADVTVKYVVHLCYGSYNNPINDLKGKFTQSEIIDFVGRSKEEQQTKQLLNIILTDIGVVNNNFTTETKEDLDLTINDEIDDVYGDYELEDSDSTSSSSSTTSTETIDVNDASGIIQKLIEVFQAKS